MRESDDADLTRGFAPVGGAPFEGAVHAVIAASWQGSVGDVTDAAACAGAVGAGKMLKGDMEESGKAGKYDLLAVIGRGAAGVVYEGRDPVLARKVAIKMLPLAGQDEESREQYTRFQQEAQAAGRLHHPNIVAVYDYGETASHAFIVMEYLSGGSLKARLERERPLSAKLVLHVMTGLLAGLQHSHSHGVVHRDIKPANVVFGEGDDPKLTDFGIARLESSSLTVAGSVLGTPAYMSPEQVLGEPADVRSDIYSAGVILYEMLSGQRPFEGAASSIMHKIVHLPPPELSKLPISVPPHFDAVVARALAKSPQDRYQTAEEFSRALHEEDRTLPLRTRVDAAAVVARPVQPVGQPAGRPVVGTEQDGGGAARAAGQPAARRAPVLAGVAALAALAIAGGVGWSMLGGPASPARHADAGGTARIPPPPVEAMPPKAASLTPITPVEPAHTAEPPPAAQATAPPLIPVTPPAPPAEPAPPPAVEATRPAVPVDPAAALRLRVAGPIAAMPCSLIRAEFTDNRGVSLTGVTGLGDTSAMMAEGALRGALGQTTDIGAVTSNIERIDGPFCAPLDTLRPLADGAAAADSAVQLGAALTGGGVIRLTVTMPNFPAILRIDRFTADGAVVHLVAPAPDAAVSAPGEVVAPNATAANATAWIIPRSDGPSVIAAIASAAPLPLDRRPSREPAVAYLSDLTAAITKAHESGRISATAQVMSGSAGTQPR